jgi:hypothetical protein
MRTGPISAGHAQAAGMVSKMAPPLRQEAARHLPESAITRGDMPGPDGPPQCR